VYPSYPPLNTHISQQTDRFNHLTVKHKYNFVDTVTYKWSSQSECREDRRKY